MSRPGDEEDEDECFYESLDRVLSSSTTSCSSLTSSDTEDDGGDPNFNTGWSNYAPNRPSPIPKFPMGASHNYDVWISQPSSIEERRTRLLRQMGLSRDPTLSRGKPSPDAAAGCREFRRSVSSDRLSGSGQQRHGNEVHFCHNNSNPGIIRSKSDSSRDHHHHHHHNNAHPSCSNDKYDSIPSKFSSKILSFDSVSTSPMVNEIRGGGAIVDNHNHSRNTVVVKSRSGNSSPVNAASPNKPPTGKNCRRIEETRIDSLSVNGETESNLDSDAVCTIKNLDNGKEFVVNEVREDGMWNKLKEVGTDRQLTLEEFEMCVGQSPIVQELMRRQNVEDCNDDNLDLNSTGSGGNGCKGKKKGNWLKKSIRNVAGSISMAGYSKERRSSDERDTSSEKGQRSSSATDDSQDVLIHGPEKIRVRQYGKSWKELSALYKCQEIQAHNGSIWTIKFSLDGKYLASAGEDCVIHVWQVMESDRKIDVMMDKPEDGNLGLVFLGNGWPEPSSMSPDIHGLPEKKRRGRPSISRKSLSFDHLVVPETVFALSEKPICSFQGHIDDVLDLSWSKSQHLLSSSMDKTVRLWHLSSKACLKIFSHSDYVTCIQFNPVDDRYFISGSLDAKVRIWSIPDRQVVDWNDLHEMVTAACYTPDGQGALVGSYKGSCRLYNAADNKLQQKSQINLQNKKKKAHQKKITGFQFAPGSRSEVIVTSADSRIRVIDGVDLVHKFKGFRNANSQISASLTASGKYVICASEDSHVYVWKNEAEARPNKAVTTITRSYEHFHCQDVSTAVPWPGFDLTSSPISDRQLEEGNHPPTPVEEEEEGGSNRDERRSSSSPLASLHGATNGYFFDRLSATWPEEKLVSAAVAAKDHRRRRRRQPLSLDFSTTSSSGDGGSSAWGMVIVTAGLRGEIRTFQNFGLPVRI